MKSLQHIYQRRELIYNLVRHNLAAAHRHKFLGRFWALLNPLVHLGVLFFIFGSMRHNKSAYVLYLMIGIVFWNVMIGTLTSMADCLRRYKTLFMRSPLPPIIFPIVLLFERFYDIFWGFVACALILFGMVYFGGFQYSFNPQILWLPFIVIGLAAWTLGVGLIIARLGAFFIDIQDIMAQTTRLGFFLTPILWEPAQLLHGSLYAWYFYLYPGAGWMMLARETFFPATQAAQYSVQLPYYPLYLALSSVFWLAFGIWFFQARAHAYTKYV